MKILAIGDFHGKFPAKLKKKAKECDLILCTGDFGGSDKMRKVIFKYFYTNWVKEIGKKKAKTLLKEDYTSGVKVLRELNKLNTPVITTMGNWDFEESEKKGLLKIVSYPDLIKKLKNIEHVKEKIKFYEKIKLYCFGGMMTATIYTKKLKGFDKDRIEKSKKEHLKEEKRLMRVKSCDILLAHYPPYKIFDKIIKEGNPLNGKNAGFEGYTKFIKERQPKVFICGHMHEHQGVKKVGKTIVVATGAAMEGKAAIINYNKKISVELI